MRDVPSTPPETLTRARRIAMDNGVHYAYTGNVIDPEGSSTWCPACHALVIDRVAYHIGEWRLDPAGRCLGCGTRIPGLFDAAPGRHDVERRPVRVHA
jgi:pyruvate formate lyase activating enzyme